MRKPPRVINFDQIIEPVNDLIMDTKKQIAEIESDGEENRQEINDLLKGMQDLASSMKISLENSSYLEEENKNLNNQIDDLLLLSSMFEDKKHSRFPILTTQDTIVCILVGVLSVIIDVIFVGTPEVVKIYKGGENFDGSILTDLLRKIGKNSDGNSAQIFKWFSDKCKVPYDISLESGVLTPNNHRLRSFAHDPFLGLLFAVADIILGTTTCTDNNGKLNVLINSKKAPTSVKWLSVIFYLGHIISDISTARGIPIPGFFVTQFFTNGIADSSIAEIAEGMYKDGYDLRHLGSMGVPVIVKDILINMYFKLTREKPAAIMSIADREKYKLDNKLEIYKMKFIANLIVTTGNAIKFIAPPNCGNPCALNWVQWMAFIKNSITMLTAATRDFTTEEAMNNRESIDEMWKVLMSINE